MIWIFLTLFGHSQACCFRQVYLPSFLRSKLVWGLSLEDGWHYEIHVTIFFFGVRYHGLPIHWTTWGSRWGTWSSTHPKILQMVDTDMHPPIVIRTSLETQIFVEFLVPRWHFFTLKSLIPGTSDPSETTRLSSMWNETVHGRWFWWQVPPLQENVTFAGVEPGDLLYDYFYDQDGSLRFFFVKRVVRGGNIKDSWWRTLCKNRACKV